MSEVFTVCDKLGVSCVVLLRWKWIFKRRSFCSCVLS